MVILSNFNTVRKIFGDDLAAGRPDRSESVIRGHDSKVLRPETGLLLSEGDVWKTHRRFALSTLRDLGMGKNWLEDTIITEVEGLCKILTNTNRKPFNPKVHLTNSVSNVICALIFGQRFSLTDPTFSRLTSLIAENLESSSADTLAQALPFLLWFPNTIRSRVLRGRRNLVSLAAFLKERVDEHAAVADRRTDVRDYLDAYQDERESGSKTAVKEKFDGK
jgi:cytochrome P450 family 2 subfamily K